MSILSLFFMPLLLAAVLLYYIVPKRAQWVLLLVCSFWFLIWCSGFKRLPFVVFDVLVTYAGARMISRIKKLAMKRWVVAFTIGLPILLLLCIKVFDQYFIPACNTLLLQLGIGFQLMQEKSVLAPIGISYFTLSTIGYVLDVYWEKCAAQKNLFKHALYVCYFPMLTSGPFVNYPQIAPQLFAEHRFDYTNVKFGLQRMLWGYLKKLVIADRIAILTGTLLAEPVLFPGLYIPLGVLCYAFQIYMDFSGCMDIVLGASETFQIQLPENFNRPFFAQNLPEFWRRWHMTLGLWAKEYILYPLLKTELFQRIGTLGKKAFGKRVGKSVPTYIGLGIVWLIIGIWHGGTILYVFAAGFLPWFFMVGGQLLQPAFDWLTRLLRINTKCWSYRLFCRLRTLFLMCIVWMFATTRWLTYGFYTIRQMLSNFNPWILTNGSVYKLGLDRANVLLLVFCLLGVLLVSILQEKGYRLRECIARQNLVFRWTLYLGAITFVIIFGMYGPGYDASAFIYGGF